MGVIMHLSIACPTIPPWGSGGWGGNVGFDQLKIQMPHHLEKSGDQPNPLHLEVIRWGFDQTKGQIPHPTGAHLVQN